MASMKSTFEPKSRERSDNYIQIKNNEHNSYNEKSPMRPRDHVLTHDAEKYKAFSISFSEESISPMSEEHRPMAPLQLSMLDPSSVWDSYIAALESSPLLTKSVTACIILGAADYTGQLIEQKLQSSSEETSIDLARFLRFAVFGLVLQAPWNHFYYQILDGALPPTEDPFTTTTAVKVVIDQFVQAPVFTLLIFYFLGLFEGKSAQMINDQLKADYKDTMLANWKLWVPATIVNIAFCPPTLRVLFLNVVFFFWSIFLSLKLNSGGTAQKELEP